MYGRRFVLKAVKFEIIKLPVLSLQELNEVIASWLKQALIFVQLIRNAFNRSI